LRIVRLARFAEGAPRASALTMATAGCDCAPFASAEPPPDPRASNSLCPARPPPRVAVCIAGGVRTFPQPQAWRSLKRNLVEAFGGVGLVSDAPDVYLELKLIDDAPKTQREWRFDPLSHHLTGDGGGALCRAVCAFHPIHVALGNASHAGSTRPLAPTRGCLSSGFFSHRENLMRALSQWSSFASCHERIAAHEAKHAGRAYDVVVLTRPDTVGRWQARTAHSNCLAACVALSAAWRLTRTETVHSSFEPTRQLGGLLLNPRGSPARCGVLVWSAAWRLTIIRLLRGC